MGKRAEYLSQADECQRMAERSNAPDIKERWLSLAAKWLAFAEQASGNGVTEFEAMLRNKGTGQQGTESSN